jgi:NAD(P)-dependent dehydrogenase (short-subunit alcohol dehydrogenase family)
MSDTSNARTRPAIRLDGKVALVTGGNRGLGREMALGFARAGADIVVASRHEDACAEFAAALRDELGVRALGVGMHVGRWDTLDVVVERVYGEMGSVDVLVNNAGMSPLYDSVDSVSEELFDKVLAVNLKGPFRLSALIGTRMAAGNGGSIINISSAGAVHPRPSILPYAAAKAGLNALTRASAEEYGPRGIRVNAIVCGTFHTDSFHTSAPTEELQTQMAKSTALGRVAGADEIVGTALYLASDASSYLTGELIMLDGG